MTAQEVPFSVTELAEIERRARAMQAQAIADAFRALRRGIVALLHRRHTDRPA